jgi:hypothetical protein
LKKKIIIWQVIAKPEKGPTASYLATPIVHAPAISLSQKMAKNNNIILQAMG